MDDAPLICCKLTSHDAEKLRHRAATWRGGKERKEERKKERRMDIKTEGKDMESEGREEGGR